VAVLGAVNATACAPVIRHGPERQAVTWPVYLGSPAHDASAAARMDSAPRPGWHTSAGREIRGAPAVGQGVMAVGNTEKTVLLLGTDSGQVLWDRRLSGTIRGGPLLTADHVYAATEESPTGKVFAMEMRTGKVSWSVKTGGVTASLTLAGGSLYAGTESGVVMAIDPDSGLVRWRRRLSGSVRAAPVFTAAGLVVVTTGDSLYLLDPATGDVRRRAGAPGPVLATPATDGQRLYLATASGTLAAIDAATLDTVWTANVGAGVYGSPALARDTLYALTRTGRLVTVPLATPAAIHGVELGIIAVAGPTPLAGSVIVADVAGVVRCVDPVTGAERWRVTVAGPVEQPALVRDGLLIVIADRGQVVSYK
jgi:outer membrane protein assembly factor BamB